MTSLLYLLTLYVPYWFGGGPRRYRLVVRPNGKWRIEMYGGGCGPFWANAHFMSSDFDYVTAVKLMAMWSQREGAEIVVDFKDDPYDYQDDYETTESLRNLQDE